MNINLDKFWEYIKEWSVGRFIILILLLPVFFYGTEYLEKLLQFHFIPLIILSILLEIFQLSAEHLRKLAEKGKTKGRIISVLCVTALISILSIIGITTYFIYHLIW